jgi:mono/diheme cytochrome c family protein
MRSAPGAPLPRTPVRVRFSHFPWSSMMRIFVMAAILAVSTVAMGADERLGREIYESHCSFCHGPKGEGKGVAGEALDPPPADFTKPDFWKKTTEVQIRDVIANGKPGTAMVPFRTSLKPDEIDAVGAYLKQFAPRK